MACPCGSINNQCAKFACQCNIQKPKKKCIQKRTVHYGKVKKVKVTYCKKKKSKKNIKA